MRSVIHALVGLLVFGLGAPSVAGVFAGARDWELENVERNLKGEITDAELGMLNLESAMEDPSFMQEIAEDLRQPEGSAELIKMMSNPSFQEQSKQLAVEMKASGIFPDFLKPESYAKEETPSTQLQTLLLALNPVATTRRTLDASTRLADPSIMAAKKAAPKRLFSPKKAAPKKVAPKPLAPKRVAAKVAPKKVAPKAKVVPKKAVPKRAVAKKAVPKRAVAKKAVPKRAAPKKSVPKRVVPKKAAVNAAPKAPFSLKYTSTNVAPTKVPLGETSFFWTPRKSVPKQAAVAGFEGLDGLIALAESTPGPGGQFNQMPYFDPLGLAQKDFWGAGNDATIAFLRHAEIKHGRVAMAGFVGYCLHENGIRWPFQLSYSLPDYSQFEGLSAPDVWDATPLAARLQIILVIGFFEFWSEWSTALEADGMVHHMKGGKPGQFPAFNTFGITNPLTPLPLFDPFGFTRGLSEEEKATKRLREIQNGRLAMIGLFSLISEARVPGAVPALSGLIKPYEGEVMGPFSAADKGLPGVSAMVEGVKPFFPWIK